MSALFASPVDSAYRRSITRSKAGAGVNGRNPFQVIMDSVVTLLANHRLFSAHTINELSGLIARAERTVNAADPRSSLIDVWAALLVVAETPSHKQSLAARRRLVVALAEMLCSPLDIPFRQRQCYWKMLKGYLQVVGCTSGYEEALTRIDQRFFLWMDVLHAAVRNGKIQPVTAPSVIAGCTKHLSAAEGLDRGWCLSPSTSLAIYDEAQYFGNTSDHWRRHTSHR